MISKEEVQRIAKLARLELTEVEVKKMQKDLSEILDYFKLLKSAPKSLHLHVSERVKSVDLRRDEAKNSDLANKLVESASDKKDGYIKVKAIL
jgi:aspartyl-tRNA(Asn)/glutamyl-tRNA(Gln) amidotransferase subunit C